MNAPERWTDGHARTPAEQEAAALLQAGAHVVPSSPEQLGALLQGAQARALAPPRSLWLRLKLLAFATGLALLGAWALLRQPEARESPPVELAVRGSAALPVEFQAPPEEPQARDATQPRTRDTTLATPAQADARAEAPRRHGTRPAQGEIHAQPSRRGDAPLETPAPVKREPDSASPTEPPAAAAQDTLGEEARLLSKALTELRRQDDAKAALSTLGEHQARFPEGVLRREVLVTRAEALRAAHRSEELLELLTRLKADGFERYPRPAELRLLNAEVASELGRCAEALELTDGLAPDPLLSPRILAVRQACGAQ